MNRSQVSLVAALFSLTGVAAPLAAQTVERGADRTAGLANLTTLPGLGDLVRTGVATTFDATSADKKGRASVTVGSPTDGKTFTIAVFGPLSEATGEAVPLSFDGLSTGAGAELSVNFMRWRGGSGWSAAELSEFCKANLKRDECDDSDFQGVDRVRFLDRALAHETPVVVTLTGGVSRTTFEYSLTEQFAAKKDPHDNWKLAGSVGWYSPTLGFLAVGGALQQTWVPAGKARQLCAPLDDTTSLECRTFVVGTPTSTRQHLVTVQWRRFLPGGRVAFSPTVAFDVRNDIRHVRLPVYFFADANGGVAGGVRADWRSDTRTTALVVFIGAALKPF